MYDTFTDPVFQCRMLHHILPTTQWISRLRYRLAMAFLLRSQDPLTEPVQDVLDLERLTCSLTDDERFNVNAHKANRRYDYEELTANANLLDVVINSCLYDLSYQGEDKFKQLDEATDKLASKIKVMFGSLSYSGASHMKQMVAKGTLEHVYRRMIYSIRSKPPPRRNLFQSKAQAGNDSIKNHFKLQVAAESLDDTPMPIRRH